ncbi:hypothetical protein [Longimicrobium sp.]|jgi:hypothetical protein|uniref:hypothetical protein n=1 Tax=Longimicrobium sp. TaxID=2029185 RepID=UPI002F948811
MINIFNQPSATVVSRTARTRAEIRKMYEAAQALGCKDARVYAIGTWRECSRRKYGGELVFCGARGMEIVGGVRVGLKGKCAILKDGSDAFKAAPESDGTYELRIAF